MPNYSLCISTVMKYIQLQPGSALPDISDLSPFRSVVVIEESVTPEWQAQVSDWLVQSGCLYMMAWGKECSTWDDSVDSANLEIFNYKNIPDDKFVMTTWHEDELLKEVFWFSKHSADHPEIGISSTLVLHISSKDKKAELTIEYENA